ncbi:hypothetical protein FPV16_06950 [Methylobacterium sp. W2]|uniref:hypothetical protein n=1 Tax=Methylobacterium sp. W2 TaxID=2598107 RepID=UPI001D0BFB87|nr:hypothetical protein [Methylobacterium sp. W2]MCC0805963.1 hypothetical protein [Methylobacterium sp. W2]
MAKEKTMAPQRTILSMPPELKERISSFRFAERIGTEAEAIRQLITEALDARDVKAGDPKRLG